MAKAKERLDVLLVKLGYAESREKAKAIIMSGIVYVDGEKEDKAGSNFPETAEIEVRGKTLKYVSRGGLKLEKALQVSERLDGHIVTGHVDGIGELLAIENHGKSTDFIIQITEELSRYVTKKGSIAADGISLTVNDLPAENHIRLTIIPHTVNNTNIRNWQTGQKINIEVDLLARYIERLLNFSDSTDRQTANNAQELTYETLLKNNFI